MSKPLDYIIFVGFHEPDENTSRGKAALRHIMDAANVQREGIVFYPAGKGMKEIVKETFYFDASQKHKFKIGNTLCIGAESLDSTYEKKLMNLSNLDISVRAGMQDVLFEDMNETEISEWLETGKYTPRKEEDKKEEDFLSGLLGDDSEDDILRALSGEDDYQDSQEPQNDNTVDSKESNDSDEDDDFELSSFDFDDEEDEDETSVDLGFDASSIAEPGEELVGQDNTQDSDDDFGYIFDEDESDSTENDSAENQEDEEEFDISSLIPQDDRDEDYDDSPVERTSTPPAPSKPVPTPPPSPEPEPEPEPEDKKEEESIDDLLSDSSSSFDFDFDEDEGDDYEEDDNDSIHDNNPQSYDAEERFDRKLAELEEENRQARLASEKEQDDMEYVNQIKESRAAHLKRRKAQLKKNKERSAQSKNRDFSTSRTSEDRAHSSRILGQEAESYVENDRNEDGSKKNYRDYLGDKKSKQQSVQEKARKNFGDIRAGKSHDSKYVGKDLGRIILVTSGKGGVGKSLVAAGMATALSLARARDKIDNPGSSSSKVWLIESDFNSPKLCATYNTKNKHLGNIADALADKERALNNDSIIRIIEENVCVDKDTGVNVLACPELGSTSASSKIPHAISTAIKYASDRGGDVIIDHGNLTDGEYSDLDYLLSMKMAHRIVLVTDMGCIKETRNVIDLLTEQTTRKNGLAISIVLNRSREQQFYAAEDFLAPYEIIGMLPPVPHLQPENSMTGRTDFKQVPKDVQKAIIDRCGFMISKLGYNDLKKYFSGKSLTFSTKRAKENIFKRIADAITKG